jgi:hypothetical protein
VLTISIVASALIRALLAVVALRMTVATRFAPKTRMVVQGLQVSSAVTSVLAAVAALIVQWWLNLHRQNASFYIFFISEFAYFLLYDLWLILRDRALQCAYFNTPKLYIWIVGLLIASTFATMVIGLKEYGTFASTGVYIFAGIFFLQLLILSIMTWLFTRPLRANFGVAEGLNLPGFDVLRVVVLRTAMGSMLHLCTSVLYIAMLVIWSEGLLCSVSRGSVYYMSTLGFTLHLNISHRDDLPVCRLASLAFSKVCKLYWHRGGNEKGQPTDSKSTLSAASAGEANARLPMPKDVKKRESMATYTARLAYEESDLVESAPKPKRTAAESGWAAASQAASTEDLSATRNHSPDKSRRTMSIVGSAASGGSLVSTQLTSLAQVARWSTSSRHGEQEELELTPSNSLSEDFHVYNPTKSDPLLAGSNV